jgi:hypothetical protein
VPIVDDAEAYATVRHLPPLAAICWPIESAKLNDIDPEVCSPASRHCRTRYRAARLSG